jgi:hypothetical protein
MFTNRIEKFLIEAVLIDLTNDTSTDISKTINSIAVKKDYQSNSFPLFVINMKTTMELRDRIRDNKVKISLKVSKYIDIDLESQEDEGNLIIDEVIIDTTIRVYSKEYSASNAKIEEDNEETPDTQLNTLQGVFYQISGIPEELITKNDIVINEVYENAKIEDVIVNLISRVESNLYMDPPNNNDKEESLLIPPLNIVPALRYIEEVYGIYNAPFGIFFDLDKTYLFNNYLTERDYFNKLEINVINANNINNDVVFSSAQVDESNNVRLYLRINPPFVSDKEINRDTIGETTVFSSYDKNFDVIKRIYSNTDERVSNNKVKYYWNFYGNKIFEESLINSITRNDMVTIAMSNISPNYFNINTLYTITSDDSYISGRYTLIENSFILSTTDYTMYTSLSNLTLMKLD